MSTFVKNPAPGLLGLLVEYPQLATPICALLQQVLRIQESSIPVWFRERIAAEISEYNGSKFCQLVHTAISKAAFDNEKNGNGDIEWPVLYDVYLKLAQCVAQLTDTSRLIQQCQMMGAGSDDIHLVILIASVVCMENRYNDGCNTIFPLIASSYQPLGDLIATAGYLIPGHNDTPTMNHWAKHHSQQDEHLMFHE